MIPWTKLAYLTGPEAKAAALDDSTLARRIRDRLGDERISAWSRLPLVVRLRAGGDSRDASKHFPWRILDLAPPNPSLDVLGRQGSHLLLDTVSKRQRLVIVLYDWDTLALSVDALDQAGLPAGLLVTCLEKGRRRGDANEDESDRWQVRRREDVVEIHTGLLDEPVSPVVGRLNLGSVPVDGFVYDVEVVALPRLSARQRRYGHTVDLNYSPEPARTTNTAFLHATTWASGTPATLMGLLRLAHGATVQMGDAPVRLASDDDPSPLAWLALADALEQAVDHQRRQYVRQAEVRRAPVGTIQMGAWMNNLARQQPDRVPVTRFSLSADCLENRLLRGIAHHVSKVLGTTGELGRWMARRFDAVEAAFDKAQLVEPDLWMCEMLLQRELPPPIERAVDQCKAALSGRYPGLDLRPGAVLTARSFELNLASLFEAAMRQLVQDLASRHGLEASDGNTDELVHNLHWTGTGGGNNRLKPDLALRTRWGGPDRAVVALGDAKYKRPMQESSYRPLSRSDFQQVMTYMLAWPSARWGLLLMPWEDATPNGPASHQLQELLLPDGRLVGVFQVSAAHWGRSFLGWEPLLQWVEARLLRRAGASSRLSGPTSLVGSNVIAGADIGGRPGERETHGDK